MPSFRDLLRRLTGGIFGQAKNDAPDSATPGSLQAVEDDLPIVDAEPSSLSAKDNGSLQDIIDRVVRCSGAQLDAALRDIASQVAENPDSPYLALELCLLRKKAGDDDGARASAAMTIANALQIADDQVALAITREFWSERTRMALTVGDLELLAQAFLREQGYIEAGWAIHSAALIEGNPIKAQQALLDIAHRAGDGDRPKLALQLYHFFLKRYPESNLVHAVEDAIEHEQHKLVFG